MKRKVFTILIILAAFLLQSTLFAHLTFGSVRPNLLVAVCSSFAFIRGKREGMSIAVVCGFFADLFWGPILGFHMFMFTIIGYVCGSFRSLFYYDDLKLPLLFVALSEMFCGLFTYTFRFMLNGDFRFFSYLGKIILPETIYTVIVTLVIYQIILIVNKKLESEEQRSASKFV